MTTPTKAPLLDKMQAWKEKLEADRAVRFKRWKAALEAEEGNVTRAAWMTFLPGGGDEKEEARVKSYGMYLTRTFGLKEFAAELRRKAGHKPKGRPWPKKTFFVENGDPGRPRKVEK